METENQEIRKEVESNAARRIRWKAEWLNWQSSGLTQKAYAQERGVSHYSLRDWHRKFSQETNSSEDPPIFREVKISTAEAQYEIEIGNKRLKLSGAFSIERAKQLLEVLS